MQGPGFSLDWFDHGGRSTIAGVPVVGESYYGADVLHPAARDLQRRLGRPVTHATQAAHHPGCGRVVVWFTLPHLCPGPAEGFAPGE